MFLYGASGHSKVIIEIVKAIGERSIEGLYDDNPKYSEVLDIPIIHDSDIFGKQKEWVISIGNNIIRKKIAERLEVTFVSLIHPRAVVSTSSKLGIGSVVMAGVVINANVEIGKHVIINTGSVIEHDCVIGDYVHISPNAALAGNVTIKEGTHIGINSCVIQGVTIGKWVTVGAGAVIVKDIPDYAVVVGNPGRVIKFNEFF